MSKKILIIEDEPYLAEMYQMKFEMAGYAAVTAGNGEEGIAMAIKEQPDLILLDLIMPKKDGLEVLNEMKAKYETKKLKVFMLSNINQEDQKEKCLRAGADAYLVKASLTPTQLLEYVNGYFSGLTPEIKKTSPAGKNGTTDLPANDGKKHIKILLIEDQEDILHMYRMRLGKEGFDVETAKNGAWGLKLSKEIEFSVIVMDIMMPAMNGMQMLEEIRRDSKNVNTPIIVLSNSAQDRDIETAKQHGATSFLLKSKITPVRLVKEIEKNLANF